MASIKNFLQDLQGKVEERYLQKIELINGLDPFSVKRRTGRQQSRLLSQCDIPRHHQLPDI